MCTGPQTATTATGHDAIVDRGRVQWADVAKGLCILLVVVHHVVGKHLPLVLDVVGVTGPVADAWATLDAVFKPLRMPLFFVISGTFAASAVRRPWPSVLGRRVLTPYWVYVAWLAVHLAVFALVATSIETHRPPDLLAALPHLLYAATGVWYLYALAVYFVLAKVLSRYPARLVLAGAALLSASASYLPVEGVNRMSILQCLVFFLAGCYVPDLLAGLGRLSARGLTGLVAGYAAVAALAVAVDATRSLTLLVLAPFAVPLGAQVAMRFAARPLAGHALGALGRRTLPVYVLHMPLLGLFHQLLPLVPPRPPGPPTGLTPPMPGATLPVTLAALLYPVLVVALLVAVSLLLHAGAMRTPMAHLFGPPQRLLDRLERWLTGRSTPAPPAPPVRSSAPGRQPSTRS